MEMGAVSRSSPGRRLERMGEKHETKEDREILQVPRAHEENPKTRGGQASRCPDHEDRGI